MPRLLQGLLVGVLVLAAGLTTTVRLLLNAGSIVPGFPWDQLASASNFLASVALGTLVVLGGFWIARRALVRGGHPSRRRALQSLQGLALVVVLAVAAAGGAGGLGSALISVGIVGFGLTLALQRPILAFAAWGNIRFGRMFQEGDRIEVGGLEGDVLEIRLLTTRLWELGGPGSPTPGRPTGRVRIVSNALFLEQAVANATSDTATIFDEFVVTVAYEADLELARSLLRQAASKVVDLPTHQAAASQYRRLTKGMSMERHFPAEPTITMHLEPDWIELRLRFLVDARRRSLMRSELALAWQTSAGVHADRLPNVYRRSQVQAIGPDGRPLAPAGGATDLPSRPRSAGP